MRRKEQTSDAAKHRRARQRNDAAPALANQDRRRHILRKNAYLRDTHRANTYCSDNALPLIAACTHAITPALISRLAMTESDVLRCVNMRLLLLPFACAAARGNGVRNAASAFSTRLAALTLATRAYCIVPWWSMFAAAQRAYCCLLAAHGVA